VASFSTETARQVWKILLRLKGSSQCGVSTENNGGPWWPPVVVGDGEEAWDIGNGFGRRKEKENGVFPRLHEIQRLKHSNAYALGKRSVSHTPEDISQIATIRLWKSVL